MNKIIESGDVCGQDSAQRTITASAFNRTRDILHAKTGIRLRSGSQQLVISRLAKRLRHYQFSELGEYLDHIDKSENCSELKKAINLLTTNETAFFRDVKQFEFLKNYLGLYREDKEFIRIWCAAVSSGEEAYSAAMVANSVLNADRFEVIGTDINSDVLNVARQGLYSIDRTHELPADYLQAYCLRGTGRHDGKFLISNEIKNNIQLSQLNLIDELPNIGKFDIVFLRNIFIYFDENTRKSVMKSITHHMTRPGLLLMGSIETAQDYSQSLHRIAPSIYVLGEPIDLQRVKKQCM